MGKEWVDIGRRVMTELKNDHVQIVAAGTAFYFFPALFPAEECVHIYKGDEPRPRKVF